MPDPQEPPLAPDIPPETPPQLRLLLVQLTQALLKNQPKSAQGYLWASLEQLIRFYAGLALQAAEDEGRLTAAELDALRQGADSLSVCTLALAEAVTSLTEPSKTRRGEQIREVFQVDAPEPPLFTRWLGLAGPPIAHPPLFQWRPSHHETNILSQAARSFLPILRSWLEASRGLFLEERFTLDREVGLAMLERERPAQLDEPLNDSEPAEESRPDAEAPARWDEPVKDSQPVEVSTPEPEVAAPLDEPVNDSQPGEESEPVNLQLAEEALARNLFEIAEQEYSRVLERQSHPAALAGRGRARSCLGRYAEAAEDLAEVRDPLGLFYRASNQRCSGQLPAALADVEQALELTREPGWRAAFEMERGGIQAQMGLPALPAFKSACELYQELANREQSTPSEVELACALVEKAFECDPTFKDHRSRTDRNQAIAIFKKLKKREPIFSLDIELMRYVMERRDPWGRPDTDLLVVERDLRTIRVLLELQTRSQEMVPLQARFLVMAERLLEAGSLPESFTTQLFGLFSDLAMASGCNDDRRWQMQHWLNLSERFSAHGLRMRCLVLACSSLQNSQNPDDGLILVQLLDQLAAQLPYGLPSGGLDLLGAAFNAVRGHLQRWGSDEAFRASVQAMANAWRALPATLPGRAGVGRQVLSELAGRKAQNVESN